MPVTSPALLHSAQRRSSRAPPWTSASAGSANRPRSGWREELRHRTANPGESRGREKGKWCQWPQLLGNQNKRSVRAEPTAGKEKCCCSSGDTCGAFLPAGSESSLHKISKTVHGCPHFPPFCYTITNRKRTSVCTLRKTPKAVAKPRKPLGATMKSEVWTHQNLDPLFHHQGGVIGGLTNSHNGGDSVFLQLL